MVWVGVWAGEGGRGEGGGEGKGTGVVWTGVPRWWWWWWRWWWWWWWVGLFSASHSGGSLNPVFGHCQAKHIGDIDLEICLCVAGTRLVASFRKIFGRGGRVARWATSPPSPPSPPSAPSPHKADQTRPTKQGRPNKADQTKPTKQGQSKQGTVKVLALCARMDRSSATRTRKIQNKNENPHAQTTPKNENHKGQIKQLKGEGRKRGHF